MIESAVDMLNLALDALQVTFDGYINRYGFYIPTDPYTFIFWKDVVIAVCLAFVFRYRWKWKKSKNDYDRKIHDYVIAELSSRKDSGKESFAQSRECAGGYPSSWERVARAENKDELDYQDRHLELIKDLVMKVCQI